MHYLNEQNIFLFLVQVFLLLGFSRVLGEFFRRHGQPAITAEILVGVIFGPTVFGRLLPQMHQVIFPPDIVQINMLETIAWLGVLFFLMEAGLEIDFISAWRQKGDALRIELPATIIPIVLAFIGCSLLPDRYFIDPHNKLIVTIFMATVMTITAMPVMTRILYDLNLSKTDLGFLIMTALSVNDILGWLILTVILILSMTGTLVLSKVFVLLFFMILFIAFCLTLGRKLTDKVIATIKAKHMPEPSTSLTFICLLGLLCGAVTQKIGINALLGFFLAGIMAGGSRALSEKTRQVISQMVFAIFVPLFFASIGLKIDFLKNFDIFLVLVISTISIAAKFSGAWLGSGLTKLSKADRLFVAVSHIPGGMMEIVVGFLALEHSLITETIFVAIVFSAILSAVAVGPILSLLLKQRKEMSVIEFFSSRMIHEQLKGNERDEVIDELCEIVSHEKDMPAPEVILNAVLKRENTMGTAMEEGIAVPHVHLSNVLRPMIVFGRSLVGVDWNSPDGQPTHFIFLIITSDKDYEAHVQILRAIAHVMSHENTREELLQAKDATVIWPILQKAFTTHQIIRK